MGSPHAIASSRETGVLSTQDVLRKTSPRSKNAGTSRLGNGPANSTRPGSPAAALARRKLPSPRSAPAIVRRASGQASATLLNTSTASAGSYTWWNARSQTIRGSMGRRSRNEYRGRSIGFGRRAMSLRITAKRSAR